MVFHFLRKYGVASTVRIALHKIATLGFAIAADYTHATGDTKISKNGGGAANITTAPAAVAMGNGALWEVALSAAELTAAQVVVTICDAVSGKAVEDSIIIIDTYGHASAALKGDLDATAADYANAIAPTHAHV